MFLSYWYYYYYYLIGGVFILKLGLTVQAGLELMVYLMMIFSSQSPTSTSERL